MPIMTEENRPKRRRAYRWAPALALIALLPVGLFAWSWFDPVYVRIGPCYLTFGAMYGNVSSLAPGWHRFPNAWEIVVELPARSGLYHVAWVEPRKPN